MLRACWQQWANGEAERQGTDKGRRLWDSVGFPHQSCAPSLGFLHQHNQGLEKGRWNQTPQGTVWLLLLLGVCVSFSKLALVSHLKESQWREDNPLCPQTDNGDRWAEGWTPIQRCFLFCTGTDCAQKALIASWCCRNPRKPKSQNWIQTTVLCLQGYSLDKQDPNESSFPYIWVLLNRENWIEDERENVDMTSCPWEIC